VGPWPIKESELRLPGPTKDGRFVPRDTRGVCVASKGTKGENSEKGPLNPFGRGRDWGGVPLIISAGSAGGALGDTRKLKKKNGQSGSSSEDGKKKRNGIKKISSV